MSSAALGIGLLGLGVVGSGVAATLQERRELLATQAGGPFELRRVLVRDPGRPRQASLAPGLLTTSPADLLEDPGIAIIVETMGGEEPTCSLVREFLERGKHVITANKEMVAKHGQALLALAAMRDVDFRFEASVGGGIPLIAPLRQSLVANRITGVRAIINGTTNYILSRMAAEGLDFHQALAAAQELGYAEPDPRLDVEGVDACYKLAILASLAFHRPVEPGAVHCEGITRLTARDFRHARELGYAIKLLAIAREERDRLQVRVHPVFLHEQVLLAKVDGVFNAIEVEGDLVGQVIFYGRGAGPGPTASAIIGDLLEVARRVRLGRGGDLLAGWQRQVAMLPMDDLETRYYLRMSVADRPGVLAQIARVLGDNEISIASVIQKEVDETAQTAEIVIMTHLARERSFQTALADLRTLDVVTEIGTYVRIEG
ncbi:MAG: homoserine dehydrogenase [Chloroflexi bacterium]|nr:homoserine dehydrogenase [Chloroflexota bacterium]